LAVAPGYFGKPESLALRDAGVAIKSGVRL
jgi:hypothetical protein